MPPTSPHTPRLHRHRPVASRCTGGRSAEALLGAGHPLVAVLYACGATIEGIVTVAAVQLGALALWWVNASYGRALAMGAGIVQLALGLRWANLSVQRRELCLELLIAGRERLPLAAVARERRRLDDPRRQAQLATSLEQLADVAAQRSARERQRPIYNQRVLAAVEPQLRHVAARLRDGGVDLRGVALLDRMVTRGDSPLYGKCACSLRDELARGRYLLASPPRVG
jgi:hypothetical protein